jgi:hypothetical protein
MNIIDARELTRVGGKYRREGVAWCLVNTDPSRKVLENGSSIVLEALARWDVWATDWAPDPGDSIGPYLRPDEPKCSCFLCQRERGEEVHEEGPAICLTATAIRQREIDRENFKRRLGEHEERLNHLYDPMILELRSKIKDAVELFKTRRDFDNSKTAAHAERITQLESQNVELHARVTHIEAMVGLIPNTKAYCPACHEHIGLAGCSCWHKLSKQYGELLYAVQHKFDGEDRHQTALRYIREREARISGPQEVKP